MVGTAPSTTISASIAPLAFDNLTQKRKLRLRKGVPLSKTRDIGAVWKEILGLFRTATRASEHLNLKRLMHAMKDEYDRESDFNIALFKALRESLGSRGLILPLPSGKNAEDCPIVFNYGIQQQSDGTEFAIGIAREANGEQKVLDQHTEPSVGASEPSAVAGASLPGSASKSSGLAARCRVDHCVCLLKKKKRGKLWSVVEILSVMELKIVPDNSGFEMIEVSENKVKTFDLQSLIGVAQAMLYTMAWVLPSLAKLGQLAKINQTIPWVVIVGKKRIDEKKRVDAEPRRKKPKVVTHLARVLSGNIYVPKACGDAFEYAITGYENPYEEQSPEGHINFATTIYLESILFGLKIAKTWLTAKKPVTPCKASGKNVMIGQHVLQRLKLLASATLGNLSNDDENHWKVSQGEILKGRLNLNLALTKVKGKDLESLLVFGAPPGVVDVVVKVAAQPVHSFLVLPSLAFVALDKIHEKVNLSDVLYAVYKRKFGLITIMADLSLQGYNILNANNCGLSLCALWGAFTTLVTAVLIPMAENGVVHSDIRPGVNVTSNVLCKINDGHATMRLVDFDSLVRLSDWDPPDVTNFKFIQNNDSWNALTFLWWQCFALGYAWVEKISQIAMEEIDLGSILSNASDDEEPTWLQDLGGIDSDAEMVADDITKLLEYLRKVICRSDEERQSSKAKAKSTEHKKPKAKSTEDRKPKAKKSGRK